MASHEDYLDSLLKNLNKDPMDGSADDDAMLENAWSGLESVLDSDGNVNLEELLGLDPELKSDVEAGQDDLDVSAIPDLEALGSMSEDEIERLLSAGTGSAPVSSDKGTLFDDENLLGMLDDVDDDLRDISEMLKRADNNEAVDESVLRHGSADGRGAGEPEEQKPLSKREQRAQQRKLRKQEKAEAKAAAKAEKMAAKEAAKAEKMAAKEAAKSEKKGTAVAGIPAEGAQNTDAVTVKEKPVASDPLFDMSLLDSIVADAGQVGNEGKAAPAPEDSGEMDLSMNGLGSDEEMPAEQDEDGPDTFGPDTDGLPGDEGDGDTFSGDAPNFPDFVALDTEEIDSLIPEREKPEPAKRGLFAKLLDFLTEEDEDEESESLQLSDENRDILNDLDKEKADAKKKKKKKGASAGGDGKGKGGKAKKPKKPKKEKPKKEKKPEPEPLIPERKLTLKRVLPVVLACVSFGVFIIVFVNASVDFTYRQTASDAYYAGDYETCFQNFYGKDLNETEQAMFEKSRSILYIRLWLREYEMFADEGSEVEALDSLLQTVKDYPKLYEHAVQWNADTEVAAGYQTILNILLEKYGLTEEQAKEIAAIRNDRAYTRMVVEVVYGYASDSWNELTTAPEPEPEQTPLQDVLPEEEGLLDGGFIDN